MTNPHNLQVGQKLLFVPERNYRLPYETEVQAIGRKWATTSHRYRINLVTLHADGGEHTSPGRAYLSEAHREACEALREAWQALHRRISHQWTPPDGVTLADVEQARALHRRISHRWTPPDGVTLADVEQARALLRLDK